MLAASEREVHERQDTRMRTVQLSLTSLDMAQWDGRGL